MKNPKNILITGASSGIGRALAIKYFSQFSAIDSESSVNLFLGGRDSKKLEETKKLCLEKAQKNTPQYLGKESKDKELKENIFCEIIDVKNEKQIKDWIDKIEENYELDLVIANAGISAGTAGGPESSHQVNEIFAVNLNGVLNTINPAIAKMKERKSGQIALISSLAGFRGLPSSPAYSGSKAAVRVYGEALRGNLGKSGIAVNVVCPGYIKTPMTDVNEFPMPFLMTAQKGAGIIISGLRKNKSRISFPFPLFFTVWLSAMLSNKITDPLFAKLPAKKPLVKEPVKEPVKNN